MSHKQVILAQQRRDDSVYHLMETIDDVHSFLSDAERTETIKTHREILEALSALTVECAYLIRDYTVDKSFCELSIKPKLINVSLTNRL